MAFWRKEKEKNKNIRQQRKEVRRMKEYREEPSNSSQGEHSSPLPRKDNRW